MDSSFSCAGAEAKLPAHLIAVKQSPCSQEKGQCQDCLKSLEQREMDLQVQPGQKTVSSSRGVQRRFVDCETTCSSQQSIEHRLSCPDCCGHVLKQDNRKDHDCLLEYVHCDFECVGCSAILHRKDIVKHIVDNANNHISMITDCLRKKDKAFADLARKYKRLKQEMDAPSLTYKQDIIPVLFRLENFEDYKQTGKQWYSSPFYSHSNGYKLCIEVLANGSDRGYKSHVSVFVHLMKGEFDDQLTWPLHAIIKLQLLSHEGKSHLTKDVTLAFSNRITHRKITGGYGYTKFVSHVDLESKYLRNDSIHILAVNFSYPAESAA